jgi:hypothetical protein
MPPATVVAVDAPAFPPDESRWTTLRSPTNEGDRRAYELDCLAHVRHWFRSVPRDDRHDVREAWLEGGYPATKVLVRWIDRFYEREHVESYRIWSPVSEPGTAA